MKDIILFAATTGYQVRAFNDAARQLGVRLTLATDRCHILDDPWADRAIPVRFEDPEGSAEKIPTCDGVLAVGDRPALAAAHAAERLGVPFHSVDSVTVCHDKALTRDRLRAAGLLQPESVRIAMDNTQAPFDYPVVLKPLHLSASRGVIRANDREEYQAARLRISRIDPHHTEIQVEQFIPGKEFALEGVMTRGRLRTFTVFEKPDPLDGPFFEESIYLTMAGTRTILQAVEQAVHALGLWHGPVHAEVRVNDHGVFVLEIAARPIGGLCAGVLRFTGGESLEKVLLRHACGEDVTGITLDTEPAGVMMIPIGRGGVFQSVTGVEEALAVPGITSCVITAKPGYLVVPLPEGASYLGFLFARASERVLVDEALREAHSRLRFEFLQPLSILKP